MHFAAGYTSAFENKNNSFCKSLIKSAFLAILALYQITILNNLAINRMLTISDYLLLKLSSIFNIV